MVSVNRVNLQNFNTSMSTFSVGRAMRPMNAVKMVGISAAVTVGAALTLPALPAVTLAMGFTGLTAAFLGIKGLSSQARLNGVVETLAQDLSNDGFNFATLSRADFSTSKAIFDSLPKGSQLNLSDALIGKKVTSGEELFQRIAGGELYKHHVQMPAARRSLVMAGAGVAAFLLVGGLGALLAGCGTDGIDDVTGPGQEQGEVCDPADKWDVATLQQGNGGILESGETVNRFVHVHYVNETLCPENKFAIKFTSENGKIDSLFDRISGAVPYGIALRVPVEVNGNIRDYYLQEYYKDGVFQSYVIIIPKINQYGEQVMRNEFGDIGVFAWEMDPETGDVSEFYAKVNEDGDYVDANGNVVTDKTEAEHLSALGTWTEALEYAKVSKDGDEYIVDTNEDGSGIYYTESTMKDAYLPYVIDSSIAPSEIPFLEGFYGLDLTSEDVVLPITIEKVAVYSDGQLVEEHELDVALEDGTDAVTEIAREYYSAGMLDVELRVTYAYDQSNMITGLVYGAWHKFGHTISN